MKKLYFILFVFIGIVANSQVIITELADPNGGETARYVELYNIGANQDLTDWELRRWTNGNASTSSNVVDLSSVGVLPTGGFVTIATSSAGFMAAYGFLPTIVAGTGGPADSNGDDQIGLFNDLDVMVDIFGVPGEDGTGTCHEFEDGRAERLTSVTTGNTTWNESEWNVWADSTVSGCTSHTNSPRSAGTTDFDPGVWGVPAGPVINVGSSVSGLDYVEGSGPSAEGNSTVEGTSLTADILLTAPTNFEISETSGSGYTNSITLTQSGGSVANTTIYVRLKSGLTGATYSESILATSAGATDKTIPVQGTVSVTTDLILNEFLADPDATGGDANGDGTINTSDDEFFELYNNGASSVDLENYTIEDGFGLRHTFPAGSIVPAGGFITVYGGGTPTGISGIVQTASSSSLGLNNGGDTITLKNGTGATLISYTYGSEGGNNQSLGRSPDFTGSFVEHSSITGNSGALFSPGLLNTDATFTTDEFLTRVFKIYPNPTNTGFVTISSNLTDNINVAVYDLLGKQVKNGQLANNILNVSDLNNGLYLVKLTQNGKTTTKKLVVN